MKKMIVSVVVFLFCCMTLFAQVSFGEVQIRLEDRIVLVAYGFTNTYDDINIFTLREINGTMPRTLEWVLANGVMVDELKNEMNRRNVNFAFRMIDQDGRYLLYIWRRVGRDFFFANVIW